jgi:predicted ATP-grasp superfamily ATP-dependent carboligase
MRVVKHVLVLGGYTAGLAVIRALGRRAIPVSCVYSTEKEVARHSKFLDATFCSPAPEEETSFLDYLLSLARSHPKSLLIPTSDETLAAVARGKNRLAEHFDVACMEFSRVDLALDKRKTAECASKHHIPAPRTFSPESTRELKACAEAIGYPCLVKPTSSYAHFKTFGRKMTKVHSVTELVDVWRESAEASVDVVLQEFIPGPDTGGVNYNAYFRNTDPIAECTARKVRLDPPALGFPTVVTSRHIPEVVDLGRRVLRSFGLSGFSCTEFKFDDRDRQYKLMEINARPNMSGALSIACGVDFPHITYDDLSRNTVTSRIEQYEEGIYWIDTLADIRVGMRHVTSRGALQQLIAPYRAGHVHAVLDFDDWRPFAAALLRHAPMRLGRARSEDRPTAQTEGPVLDSSGKRA